MANLKKLRARSRIFEFAGLTPAPFRELRQQPAHWFWALNAITGEDPAPAGSTFEEKGAVATGHAPITGMPTLARYSNAESYYSGERLASIVGRAKDGPVLGGHG